jgi:hypothetical protein
MLDLAGRVDNNVLWIVLILTFNNDSNFFAPRTLSEVFYVSREGYYPSGYPLESGENY